MGRTIRRTLLIALIALPVVFFWRATPSHAADASVDIASFAYHPVTLTVQVGTKVTWGNDDDNAHSVTSDTGAFDSGILAYGATYSRTFDTAGTFAYHCKIHSFMKAEIIVSNDAPPTTGPTAAAPTATTAAAPTATSAAATSVPATATSVPATATSVPTTVPVATQPAPQPSAPKLSLKVSGILKVGQASTLTVTVKGKGKALSGAKVAFNGKAVGLGTVNTKTDSKGTATLANLKATKKGKATVTASKSGFKKATKTVNAG